MTIEYDREADAANIRLSETQGTRTDEESDVCVIDLDADGAQLVALQRQDGQWESSQTGIAWESLLLTAAT